MFGMFNKKSRKPPLLSHETGAGFDMDDIKKAAQYDCDWDNKKTLMQGCLQAFENGRHENMRVFVTSYLEFKRQSGAVDRVETQGLDSGFDHLISKPIVQLLERQQDPQAVLDILSAQMSAYYKQIMLDIVLRHACSSNSWMVVPVLLQSGADANAGRGRPLSNAARQGHVKITTMLLQAGADIDMARSITEAKKLEAFDTTITAARKPATEDAPQPQTLTVPRLDDIATPSRPVIKKPSQG